MSKRSRRRKAEARARREARRLTAGKVFRLLVKSIVFAVVFSGLMLLLSLLGFGWVNRWYVQLGLAFALYLLAYPVLMREFRPRTYREDA